LVPIELKDLKQTHTCKFTNLSLSLSPQNLSFFLSPTLSQSVSLWRQMLIAFLLFAVLVEFVDWEESKFGLLTCQHHKYLEMSDYQY